MVYLIKGIFRSAFLACLGLFLGLTSLAPALADEDISLKTRPGVTVELARRDVNNPTAMILMFPGGPGHLNLHGRGPVAQFYKPLMAQGFSIAAMDAPSDMSNGLSPRARGTDEHLQDLKAVIAHLRKVSSLPLWVWGISRGAYSAGHAAVNAIPGVSGYVFLSSPTRLPRRANVDGVAGMALDRIKAPVLAIGHEDDECRGTPARGARRIADAARNSSNARSKLISGGSTFGGRPCGPGTAHTFNGIENQVAREIAAFIKAN
jgi:pimeloyl-ACP methyl ester carboxylesterase